jgi:hypothetical protein
MRNNLQVLYAEKRDAELKSQLISAGVAQQNKLNGSGVADGSAGYKAQLAAATQIFNVQKGLTQEQYSQSLEINKQIGLSANKVAQLKAEKDIGNEIRAGLALMKATEDTDINSVKRRVEMRKLEAQELRQMQTDLIEMQYIEAEALNLEQQQKLTSQEKVRLQKELGQYKQTYIEVLTREGFSTQEANQKWKEMVRNISEAGFKAGDLATRVGWVKMQEEQSNQAIAAGLALIRAKDPLLAAEIEKEIQKLNLLKQLKL